MKCARCKETILPCCTTGESAIYGSCHILCEPCFFSEDEEINEHGNVMPDTLLRYGVPNG